MQILIVTGMSGSGKSRAMASLEDIGYYCMDNVPAALLGKISVLLAGLVNVPDKVAVGVDVRGGELYSELDTALKELKSSDADSRVLFLDADDSVLINRYKETRRRHPLIDACNGVIVDAIAEERRLISGARSYADYFIDTTYMGVNDLKKQIDSLFLVSPEQGISILCVSYGTKHGSLNYADLCFDVRCIPNPFYVPELKPKTGLDDEVFSFVFSTDEAVTILKKLEDLIDYMLPLYVKEGKTQVVIAFCCTGGKHRSVSFARAMRDHLAAEGYNAAVNHRDINK